MSSVQWNERISISPMSDVSHSELRSVTLSPDQSLCNPSTLTYSGLHTTTTTNNNNNNISNSNSINVKDEAHRMLVGTRVFGFQDKNKACCFGVIIDTNRSEGDVNVNTTNKANEQKWNSDNNNHNNNNCQRVFSTTLLSWPTVVMLTHHIHLHDVLCSSSASSLLFRPYSIHSLHSNEEQLSSTTSTLLSSSTSSSLVVSPWEDMMCALLLQTELNWDGATQRIISWESQSRVENTLMALRTWTQLFLDGFLRWVPPSTGVRLLFTKGHTNSYYYSNSNNNNNNNIVDRCGEIRVALLGVEDERLIQEHWANLQRYWSTVDSSSLTSCDHNVHTALDGRCELYRTIAVFHKHCRPVLQQFTDDNSNSNKEEEGGGSCVNNNRKKWSIKNSMQLTYAMAIVAHIELYLQMSSSSSLLLLSHDDDDNSDKYSSNTIPFTTAEQNHFIEILAFLLFPQSKTVCEEGRRMALHWINTHLCTQEAHHILFSGPSKLSFHDFLASFAHWLLLQVVPSLLRCVNVVLSRQLCSYASSCNGCNDENLYSDVNSPSRALRLRFQREMRLEDRSAGSLHKTTTTCRRNLLGDISLTDWIKWMKNQQSELQSVSKHEKKSHKGKSHCNKMDTSTRKQRAFFFSLSPAGVKLLSIFDSLNLFNTNTTTTIITAGLSDRTFDRPQTALAVSRWMVGCSKDEVLTLQSSLKDFPLESVERQRKPLRLFTLAEFISHYRMIVDVPRIERISFSSTKKVKDDVINVFCPLPPLFDISLTHFHRFSPVNQAKLICSAVGLNYTAYVSSKEEKEHQQQQQEEEQQQEQLLYGQEEEEEKMEWQQQQKEKQQQQQCVVGCDEVGMYGSEIMMTKKAVMRRNHRNHHSSYTSTIIHKQENTPVLLSSSLSSSSTAITVLEDCGILKIYDCVAIEQLECARHSASLQLYTYGIILLQTFLRSRWSWRWNMLPLRRRAHRQAIITVQTALRGRQSMCLGRQKAEKQQERVMMWCEERKRREVMREHLIRRLEETAITCLPMAATVEDKDKDENLNKMCNHDHTYNDNDNNYKGEKNNMEGSYDIKIMSHATMNTGNLIRKSIDIPNTTAVVKAREMFGLIPSVNSSSKIPPSLGSHNNNSLAETLFTMETKGRCLVESIEAKKRRGIFIALEERVRERYLLQEYRERRVVMQQAMEQQQQATVKASQQQWRKRQMQQKQRLILLQKQKQREKEEKEEKEQQQEKEEVVVVRKKVIKPQTHSLRSSSSSSVKRGISVPHSTVTPKDMQEKGTTTTTSSSNSNDVVIVIDVNEEEDDNDDEKKKKNEKELIIVPSECHSVAHRHSPILLPNPEQLRTKRGSSPSPPSVLATAKAVGILGEKGKRTLSLITKESSSTPMMALCKHEYEDRTFIELSQRYRRQLLLHSAILSRLGVREMQQRRVLFLSAVLERQELLTRWRDIILPYTLITETLYGDFLAVMVVLQDAPRRRGPNAMRAMMRLRNRHVNITTDIKSRGSQDISREYEHKEEKEKQKRKERDLDKENGLIGGKKKEIPTVMKRAEFLQKSNLHVLSGQNVPLRASSEKDGVMEEIPKIRKIRTSSSSASAAVTVTVARGRMVNLKKGETSRSSSRKPVVSWADPPSSL
ncbi:uncharacterized protein TM35_000291950 [Trypanosoma theileri]|uniref:Uncharacterized protein n=1 Tax=Trypanosoma theileri TaxID=67003 RepID=A0A1X0NPA1_9TRYP|nr:uncharacterized protein TM35_000291950 [Trypanosoma theileri]ORC86313.1 hypothetical protein TM35_000291950 [Trypanosoma theileri]